MTKLELKRKAIETLNAGIELMAEYENFEDKKTWYIRLGGQIYILWNMGIFDDANRERWLKIIDLALENN